MILETKRLYLIPLTANQLELWTYNIPALEKELNCVYQGDVMKGEFLDIVKMQLNITRKDEKNYLFHSFWLLMLKDKRIIIGATDFKNIPNKYGEVEIGYGLNSAYEHNGYMTEAVIKMCSWALNQPNVCSIIAETEKYNISSYHVLERCNMKLYKETDISYWWRFN